MQTNSAEKVSLTIVIPCYNGFRLLSENLPPWLNQLAKLGIRYEVLVVDDGSSKTDGKEALEKIANLNIIAYQSNKGKGFAVKTGCLHAQTDLILYTDADLPYLADVVPEMIRYAHYKEFDLVAGDRTLSGSEYFHGISKRRNLGSRIFSRFVGTFVAGGLYDTQCGIKLLRKQAAHRLFRVSILNGFAFDVELFYLALKLNMDIKRVPVKLLNNESSSVWMMRDAPKMIFDVVRMIIHYYRGGYKTLFVQDETRR